MKFFFLIMILFLLSFDLWSYNKDLYEPTKIPEKEEDYFASIKDVEPSRSFYASGSFGYLFASVPDITIIQKDFTNAGVSGLNPVSGFFNFRLELGYENLFKNFDLYGVLGYLMTSTKSGTGNINYGLEPVNSTIGFNLYSIPMLVGAKYSFYNTDRIRLGTKLDIGTSLIRGNIDLRLNQTSSLQIQNSSLTYGGMGLSGDLGLFVETKVSRMLALEFDVAYNITSLSHVKITGSSENFATQFEPGKQLMIYDSITGKSTPFNVKINGLMFCLSAKMLF
ncbi:MAG: hypothetical protein WCQ47_05470 [bacterium]